MTNLQRFENKEIGIEVLVDLNTGASFLGIKGYARISGLSKQAISKRVQKLTTQGVNQNSLEKAEIQTTGGIQAVNLIPENLFTQWIINDKPELAIKIMQAGARIYLHGLAGYKYEAVEQAPTFDIESLSRKDILLMALQAEEEKEALQAQLDAQKDEVNFARAIKASDDCITIGQFAKSLDMGRNNLFKLLREMKIIEKTSTLPYQRYMDMKCFEVSQVAKDKRLFVYALVTPKGQKYLTKRITTYQQKQEIADKMDDMIENLTIG